MNVLFVSISSMPHMSGHSISLDLLREFRRNGHNVYVLCSLEKRENKDTYLAEEDGCTVLRVKIGNNKRVGLIEKGITNVMLPKWYIQAIKKYYKDVKFDLVLYPTPPITQAATVKYIKKRDGAKSYLLLKDIFPQNAVDIGMMSKSGVKGLIYKYFRKIEKNLYKLSDYIGCMSQANVDYLIKHNPWINRDIVHIAPNSIEVLEKIKDDTKKSEIRKKYNIPEKATVFVYGGNLGRPQGIPFIIDCLKANTKKEDRFFVICGNGTEYKKLELYIKEENPDNVLLVNRLPKEEYEEFITSCDVGLIFLDHRFTIPNFPSRLLSYMQNSMPTLACTDVNTDVGQVIVNGDFGWWCESNSVEDFTKEVDIAITSDITALGKNGFEYLKNNYTIKNTYDIICSKIGIVK